MLHSMTGFGRCFLEDDEWTQTWEVRSVNNRYLDIKWRMPLFARPLESRLERVVKKFASRGRVEISLNVQFAAAAVAPQFNAVQASAMLDSVEALARERGDAFAPDYNRLLSMPPLWNEGSDELDDGRITSLEQGLSVALADWNESRRAEAKALEKDILTRTLRMEEWLSLIADQAPAIKEERFESVRERLNEILEQYGQGLEEGRFLQEITLMADKLDVSEEITRLTAHLERLRELLASGEDAGRRLDFTMQECFREINTCGNKIQNAQISRLIVDFKNELEKCREQVQNLE
ncbi:YicC family protein [Desulfovibrio sp. OttesenSCG-928-O18]|nr:YicC family protein [Desulfovibrio sp. OttesenSCG-928-O18]